MSAPPKFWRDRPVAARVAVIFGLAAAGFAVWNVVSRWSGDGAEQADAENSGTAVEISAARAASNARWKGDAWRKNPSTERAFAYADALLRAGMYDQLLKELDDSNLLPDAAVAAQYRAETLLRLKQFAAALDAVASQPDNPFAAMVRARAAYAMAGDRGTPTADLSLALRGSHQLASDAWLLRARIELDENSLEAAETAARRARDTGAAPARVDALLIEAALRKNDLKAAAEMLQRRRLTLETEPRNRRRPTLDAETERLTAMLEALTGDYENAARRFDGTIAAYTENTRDPLLAALLKWLAGDTAQALVAIRSYRDAAPGDWVAIDLEAGLLRAHGRREEANALLDELAGRRPSLSLLRRLRDEETQGRLDAVLALLGQVKSVDGLGGAAAFMLGAAARAPDEIAEIRPAEIDRIKFVIERFTSGPRQLEKLARAHLAFHESPIDFALAGVSLADAGANAASMEALAKAVSVAPNFFAPVSRLAALRGEQGDFDAAIDPLNRFLAANPDHVRARIQTAALLDAYGDYEGAYALLKAADPEDLYADSEGAMLAMAIAKRLGGDAVSHVLDEARAVIRGQTLFAEMTEAAGEYAAAAIAWRDVLNADPMNETAQHGYLLAMERLDLRFQALAVLDEIKRRRDDAAAAASAPPRRQAQ